MTTEEVIMLICSFAGGGVVAGLISMWSNSKNQRKAKRIELLRSQLQDLYGPLHLYVSRNESLFQLGKGFQNAYTKLYIETQYSDDEKTQERIRRDAEQTIDISNQYIRLTTENNDHILSILENHYSLVEPEDTDTFSRFLLDYTRRKIETDQTTGVLKTPYGIFQQIGSISFMHPNFIELIKKRFKEKNAELQRLTT